jgi:hypothetical protein
MTNLARLFAAAAATAALAAPAAAQNYPYQQQYPQTYPQQYPQTYPGYGYQSYGYQQGYGGNAVTQIIDQLLGNRYNVTDRQAVSQCASAALAQAQSQYGGYGYQQQGYGYGQGFAAPMMRVTAITDVQRRSSGLRVRGRIGTGYGGQYGNQYGYQNGGYGAGDLSFRCNVDYRGAVTGLRLSSNGAYRRY